MANTDFTTPISVICDENKRLKRQLHHSRQILRDQFAMAALTGLIINPASTSPIVPITLRAYELADLMIKRRNE
jgi:hypothetical protein